MADISKLSRLLNGVQRTIDLSPGSGNALLVDTVKIGDGVNPVVELNYALAAKLKAIAGATGAQEITTTATSTNHDPSNGGAITAPFSIEDYLNSIDSALATAGGTVFDDASFKIVDGGGDSLGIVFDVSAVTTADKTITMPDADVDLGNLNLHLDGTANKHDASEIDVEAIDGKNHTATDLESVIGQLDDAIGDFTAATYNNYTDPTAHNVVAHLNAIDSALASAGATSFDEAAFSIFQTGTQTNTVTFDLSALTAPHTITMPDADVNLGDIATLNNHLLDDAISKHDADQVDYERADLDRKNIQAIATSPSVETALTDLDDAIGTLATSPTNYVAADAGIVADHLSGIDTRLGNIYSSIGTTAGSTDLGTFTGSVISDSSNIKNALQQLETYAENISSIANNFEWANSAADYIVDNTLAPPTENPGDRYVLSDDGGAPNAAWDGASAGDIVEFNGTSGLWEATTPTTGTFISVDDDQSGLYQWGGSSWAFKAFEATTASGLLEKTVGGFDIKIADSAAANIIVYNSSGVASSVAMSGEATISDTGAVTLDNASVIGKLLTGIDFLTNGTVTATDSLLAAIGKLTANQNDISTLIGVDTAANGPVDLGTFTGDIIADNTTVKNALQQLETELVDTRGNADDLIALSGAAENTTDFGTVFTGSTIADNQTIQGALQDLETQVDANESDIGSLNSAVSDNTDAIAALQTGSDAVIKSFTAGEAMAAETTFLVRMALNGETAGRVYKADEDAASTDSFYVIGVVMSDVAVSAGDTVSVTMMGESSLGTSDTAFAAGDVGKPVYLGASGAFSTTAPTLTDKAVVRVGIVQETTKILVQAIQLNGIN
jgi:hypothetical protein